MNAKAPNAALFSTSSSRLLLVSFVWTGVEQNDGKCVYYLEKASEHVSVLEQCFRTFPLRYAKERWPSKYFRLLKNVEEAQVLNTGDFPFIHFPHFQHFPRDA